MPQPFTIPNGKVIYCPGRVLLERPRLAQLLGAITGEWGRIDNTLIELYVFASVGKTYFSDPDSEPGIRHAAFDRITSFRGRCDVISEILKMRRLNAIKDEFDKCAQNSAKVLRRRNLIVHANWFISADYPNDLLRKHRERFTRYTEKDFEGILTETEGVYFNLFKVYFNMTELFLQTERNESRLGG